MQTPGLFCGAEALTWMMVRCLLSSFGVFSLVALHFLSTKHLLSVLVSHKSAAAHVFHTARIKRLRGARLKRNGHGKVLQRSMRTNS